MIQGNDDSRTLTAGAGSSVLSQLATPVTFSNQSDWIAAWWGTFQLHNTSALAAASVTLTLEKSHNGGSSWSTVKSWVVPLGQLSAVTGAGDETAGLCYPLGGSAGPSECDLRIQGSCTGANVTVSTSMFASGNF